MNCLYDFVGLKGCSTDTPLSGVWINDFPGMSNELMEKISTDEQQSYVGFWQSIQRSAYQAIKTDIQRYVYLSADALLEQVIFETKKEFVQQWQQVQPLDPQELYQGVLVSIQGSKYMGLRIDKLMINNLGSALTGVPVKIVQSQDCKVLWEAELDLEPGMNYPPVNETFYSDYDKVNIVILVDSTNLTTAQGPFMDWGWTPYDIDCQTRFSQMWSNGFSLYPVTAPLDYGIGNNWTINQIQNGIYFEGQLICSLDSFICRQKQFLIQSWATKLCYQILWAKLTSNRGNYFAQNNRELTERNMATYKDEYEKSLAIWAKQLNLAREGLCFNCEEGALVSTGYRMP